MHLFCRLMRLNTQAYVMPAFVFFHDMEMQTHKSLFFSQKEGNNMFYKERFVYIIGVISGCVVVNLFTREYIQSDVPVSTK